MPGRTVAGARPADIEQTIASAIHAAAIRRNQALGLVPDWLGLHAARVIVPRLQGFIANRDGLEGALWSAIGHWLGQRDVRWHAMARIYDGPRLELGDPASSRNASSTIGEDPRFAGSALRVPRGALASRTEKIASELELVARHAVYRQRVMFGPTVRADLWVEIDRKADTTAAELARVVGCSYEQPDRHSRTGARSRPSARAQHNRRGRRAYAINGDTYESVDRRRTATEPPFRGASSPPVITLDGGATVGETESS